MPSVARLVNHGTGRYVVVRFVVTRCVFSLCWISLMAL